MLTTLLSLYIVSVIEPNITQRSPNILPSASAIIKTASFDFESLAKEKTIPIKDPTMISPIIDATSAIAVDMDTGAILYEKNSHEQRPIASLTKLMTITIVLEENALDDVVEISHDAATTEGSIMFLKTGEQITVKNLLLGALVHSANDAAEALAEYNAGSTEAFVEKMNYKALQLGLLNTHFSNPIGLDTSDNYSSAYDLAKLSRYMYQKQFVQNAALLKEVKVTSVDGKYTHNLSSTNELLGNEHYNIRGLKTGKTDLAGLCMIAVADNKEGNRIITVLLDSPSRFTETKILIDWTFRAYNWGNNVE